MCVMLHNMGAISGAPVSWMTLVCNTIFMKKRQVWHVSLMTYKW